jgi:hypothetical protein
MEKQRNLNVIIHTKAMKLNLTHCGTMFKPVEICATIGERKNKI